MTYNEAGKIIIEHVKVISSERAALSQCGGRISAQDITAKYNVPSFDRSPYDGYAFKVEDTVNAPVKLRVVSEIRAGSVMNVPLKTGEAAKIMTGAKIPEGADAVIKYEDTEYTDSEVIISRQFKSDSNIIRAGEDIQAGKILVHKGDVIDSGRAGLIASQGIFDPEVYMKVNAGIISTGDEIMNAGEELHEGKIYNTNRYAFEAALNLSGFIPKFMGTARDDENEIASLIAESLPSCDVLILTGGVSAGDYDRIPAALNILGAKVIVRDVDMKPGGKCIYALMNENMNEKLICCLSGNPASALTNYYAVLLPALRKISGLREFMPEEINLTLGNAFTKRSPKTRIIRGILNLSSGHAVMNVPSEQGNGVLSSMSGCNVMAVIPAGSERLSEGTMLKGFML